MNTRRSYTKATVEFLSWCELRARSLDAIRPIHVAGWIEELTGTHAAPTVKQRLAAVRHLFDWLVTGHVMQPVLPIRCGARNIPPGEARRRSCLKQDAGFLSGKDGLPTEFGVVLDALQNNVPAMLTDLTTTIRDGDVVLMGASDPYLVEVKAKKSKNERARKQKKNLEILHEFFENDRSDRLRA